MPDVLFYALLLAAALACPIHMWWANRRGHRPACCPPKRQQTPQPVETLVERRAQIQARLAELEVDAGPSGPAAPTRTAAQPSRERETARP